MNVTDLSGIYIVDVPNKVLNGTPQDRIAFSVWIYENFRDDAFIFGNDVWITNREFLTLYLMLWSGL